MKSHTVKKIIAGALIIGEIFTSTPSFGSIRLKEEPIWKGIKRVNDNDKVSNNHRDGVMMVRTQKGEEKKEAEEELKKSQEKGKILEGTVPRKTKTLVAYEKPVEPKKKGKKEEQKETPKGEEKKEEPKKEEPKEEKKEQKETPKGEKKKEEKKSVGEKAAEELLTPPKTLDKTGMTAEELKEEAKKLAKKYAENIKRLVEGDKTLPYTYYVGLAWINELNSNYSSATGNYLHLTTDKGVDQKKIFEDKFKEEYGEEWSEVQTKIKGWIDKGREAFRIYDNMLSQLAQPTSAGNEEAIIKDAKTQIETVLNLKKEPLSPLRRMFMIDENMPWMIEYANKHGINTYSPIARLEIMESIAKDEKFKKFKIDMSAFFSKYGYIFERYSKDDIEKAFNQISIMGQYQLMKFIEDEYGDLSKIINPQKFGVFIVGISNLSQSSSAYFIEKYGHLTYYRFDKTEDLENVLRFIGSRTIARESTYDYEYLNAYLQSLQNKFPLVLELNAYKVREMNRAYRKSTTIGPPVGYLLLQNMLANTNIDVQWYMSMFEPETISSSSSISNLNLRLQRVPDLDTDEIKYQQFVKTFPQAFYKIFGPMVNIQINAPEGNIELPIVNLDIYALEDKNPLRVGGFNLISADTTGKGEEHKTITITPEGKAETTYSSKDLTGTGQLSGPGEEATLNVNLTNTSGISKPAGTEVSGQGEVKTTTINDQYGLKTQLTMKNVDFGENTFVRYAELKYERNETGTTGETITGGEITAKDETKTKYELIRAFLDATTKGETTIVYLDNELKNQMEKMEGIGKGMTAIDGQRKFEVVVFHRRENGDMLEMDMLELTPEQLEQLFALARVSIEKSKGEFKGYLEGKSVQPEYSSLLVFNEDIFASSTYKFQGAGITAQGKYGGGAVVEKKLTGDLKGLLFGTLSENPKLMYVGQLFFNPEFSKLIDTGGKGKEEEVTKRREEVSEPIIAGRPNPPEGYFEQKPEKGIAAEFYRIESEKAFYDTYISVTEALRAGVIAKYANDTMRLGFGGYIETKYSTTAKEGATSLYIANKKMTQYLVANFIADNTGFVSSTGMRYIGENLGLKVATIYDRDANKNDQIFIGGEFEYDINNNVTLKLYNVSGEKLANLEKNIKMRLSGGKVDFSNYTFEAFSPYGDMFGNAGAISKVVVYNLAQNMFGDLKLHLTAQFGTFESGPESVTGTTGRVWTGGLGLAGMKDGLRFVILPFSYVGDEYHCLYTFGAFGQYYLSYGKYLFGGFGGEIQTRDTDKLGIKNIVLSKKMELELPLVDETRNAFVLSTIFGGGWYGGIFKENQISLTTTYAENPYSSYLKAYLNYTGLSPSRWGAKFDLKLTKDIQKIDLKKGGTGYGDTEWEIMLWFIYNNF